MTEEKPTPFIMGSEEYFSGEGGAHEATHEQLEFLGRLAELRGQGFEFTTNEKADIQQLEEMISQGRTVLVGGVAVASKLRRESREKISSRFNQGAYYGAAVFAAGARVGNGAIVGGGAKVEDGTVVPPRRGL